MDLLLPRWRHSFRSVPWVPQVAAGSRHVAYNLRQSAVGLDWSCHATCIHAYDPTAAHSIPKSKVWGIYCCTPLTSLHCS